MDTMIEHSTPFDYLAPFSNSCVWFGFINGIAHSRRDLIDMSTLMLKKLSAGDGTITKTHTKGTNGRHHTPVLNIPLQPLKSSKH